jgi:hypothetical protein
MKFFFKFPPLTLRFVAAEDHLVHLFRSLIPRGHLCGHCRAKKVGVLLKQKGYASLRHFSGAAWQ